MRVLLHKEDKSIDKIVELDCMKVYDTDDMLDNLRESGNKFENKVYHSMALVKSVNMIELYSSESDLMTVVNVPSDVCDYSGDSAWRNKKRVKTIGYLDTQLKPEVVQLYFKTNSDFNHAIKELENLGKIDTSICAFIVCKYNAELEFGGKVCESVY